MKRLFFIIAVYGMLFSACKKEESKSAGGNNNLSKTVLLCSHAWILSAASINPPIDNGGTPISDIYSIMEACDKDDFNTYLPDNTVVYDEGLEKCDPSDPQTFTATWKFNTDETILTESGRDQTIVSLTATELIYTSIQDINGINYTITETYSVK